MFWSAKSGNFFIKLLGYIMDKNNLVLEHYAKIKGVPLSELLIKAIINTDKQFMVISD